MIAVDATATAQPLPRGRGAIMTAPWWLKGTKRANKGTVKKMTFLVDFLCIFNALYFENKTFSSTESTILRFWLLYFKCRFRTLLGPFGGSFGGILGPLGGLLAAIWGLLGVSWRCLGKVFGDSWRLLERQTLKKSSKWP